MIEVSQDKLVSIQDILAYFGIPIKEYKNINRSTLVALIQKYYSLQN